MANVDFGWLDQDKNDREKIEQGIWVPCRLCQEAFRRIRLTLRYCAGCGQAFCEGEHGNFAQQRGMCVRCGGPHGVK